MTHRALLVIAATASALLGTGCVGPAYTNAKVLTAAEQAALGNTELSPAVVFPTAWQGVDATDTAVAGSIYTNAMVASGGDNLIGAIGGSITRGIARGQQRDFEERNVGVVPLLQASATSSQLLQQVDQAVRTALENTPLRSRLQPPYQAKMHVSIFRCGYSRVTLNAQQEVLLVPYLTVRVGWMAQNPPRSLYIQHIQRWAGKDHHHTAREFATQPALRDAAFKAVLDGIGQQLAADLRAKMGQ